MKILIDVSKNILVMQVVFGSELSKTVLPYLYSV